MTIPYQRTIPHDLPVVDPALDVVSPPLTCLDQGTIWSQPGNLYTHIVDLAEVDSSRAMIAPGNAEDGTSTFRTNGIPIWAQGGTRPAPLTVAQLDARARFVAAIPKVTTETKPLPGRKPDDPKLEAAFRIILRQGTPPEEVKANLAECREYVKGNAPLTEQLRSAAVLGVYLIEESAVGRLKIPYGSMHALQGLKALLKDLGGNAAPDRTQPRASSP